MNKRGKTQISLAPTPKPCKLSGAQELSGGITTLTAVIQVANFCAAMDTLIDQDASLVKGGYVFGRIGLSICLFVCGQHYSKNYERIVMKFCGGVLGGTMKN